MANKNFPVGDNETVQKYKDMGDGTHAPVVSAVIDGGNVQLSGPVTVSNEVEIKNDTGNPVPVSFASAPTVNVGTMPEVEVKNDSGNPLSVSFASAPTVNIGTMPEVEIKNDSGNPITISGGATRSTVTATIANGASVSGTVDLTSTALLGFIAPAAWTTAALNIEVSADGSTWATVVYDGSGTAVSSWSALVAGAAYAVDTVSMLPFRYARFRSGTSGSPVNQGAQRDFVVITRPLA